MKNTLFILLFILICVFNTFADIAPNPIHAKGIITVGNNDIRMASERVVIDLYKDSSVVECHFYMKNEGKDQKINIGFPEMNFHYFTKTLAEDYTNTFNVYENGIEISKIDSYSPDLKLPADSLLFQQKSKIDYHDQPWHLWDSYFKEGEIKTIKVRYRLPTGIIKSRCNFFTYLLSTGAGWKGNIDTAVIIVNLKGISNDLILKALPENYVLKENQFIWKFSNLEPTTNDDIKIYFESSKGMYEKMKTANPYPLFIFNQKALPQWDAINDPAFLDRLTSYDLLEVKILKDLETTKKYTSGKEGVVIVVIVNTKRYAVEKIDSLLKQKKINLYPLTYNSPVDFMENYKLIVDQSEYVGDKMLLKILELEKKDIRKTKIISNMMGKSAIEIELKN